MEQLQAGVLAGSGPAHISPRVIRGLAGFAITAQAAFIAIWIVASAIEPGYSIVDRYVSELGALDAAHPWLMNTGLFLLGASLLALVPGLLATLPARRSRTVAVAAFTVAGVCMAANGFLRLDCGLSQQACLDAWHDGRLSWHHDAHLWAGLLFRLSLVVTPFALARALRPHYAAQLALYAGLAGLAFGLAGLGFDEVDGDGGGIVQRLLLSTVHIWVVLVAAGILHATRTPAAFSDLIPMRARDFFHGSWDAQGELVMKPEWLWRRFARPVRIRRRSIPVGDEIWKVEDVAEFGDGQVMVRRYYCELVGEDHVHVTGDDLPDGADLRLEDDGYRIAPYRLAVPVGPVHFTMLCHDSAVALPDGGVQGTIEMTWLRIPVARLSAAVRPRP